MLTDKQFFAAKWKLLSHFSRTASPQFITGLKAPAVGVYIPKPTRVFDWRTGRSQTVNADLVLAAGVCVRERVRRYICVLVFVCEYVLCVSMFVLVFVLAVLSFFCSPSFDFRFCARSLQARRPRSQSRPSAGEIRPPKVSSSRFLAPSPASGTTGGPRSTWTAVSRASSFLVCFLARFFFHLCCVVALLAGPFFLLLFFLSFLSSSSFFFFFFLPLILVCHGFNLKLNI